MSARVKNLPSAKTRVAVSLLAGVIIAGIVSALGLWQLGALMGWDVAAILFVAWTWTALASFDARQTAAHAAAEDPTRAAADALLIIASVASLAAVGLVIFGAAGQHGAALNVPVALGVVSVVVSWTMVHTVYALRYGRLYYTKPRQPGIDFNELDGQPTYADFAYIAFTIGMTFQVSDTTLRARIFRSTALRHALLSYLFGTIIVATTINLIAGLGK